MNTMIEWASLNYWADYGSSARVYALIIQGGVMDGIYDIGKRC